MQDKFSVTSKDRSSLSDDALGWIGMVLVLIAAIILDKGSTPHKWHAAIMWTFVAFFGALIFGRRKRNSFVFWIFWVTCLTLHGFAMWVMFGQLFPRLILGTLYVVPLAFIEALLLLGMFTKLEGKLSEFRSR
ncbi:MAG TPA: hypothetical protein VGR48_12500 [Terriglobales bacterium]|nr:hypothetical protein [Terriglobales bacterium]